MWINLKESIPVYGEKVLILFSNSGHVEDATFHEDVEGGWIYMLFDGECLNDSPTHWMPFPELP